MLIETALLSVTVYIASKRSRLLPEGTFQIKKRLSDLDAKYQRIVQKKLDDLFGDKRGRQLEKLYANKALPAVSEVEKDANRRLGVASTNLGLGMVCALFYPHLLILTVPFTFWLAMPRFKSASDSLFKEHKVTIAVVDSTLVIWALLSGYWFASVLGTSLISISLRLLAKTKNNYHNRLVNVFKQQPCSVWIYVDDSELEIPFEDLKFGDIVVASAGETLLADGVIVQGIASVDQHLLTGESQPAEKTVGEQVFASTVILSGKIYVKTEKAGYDTVAAQLVEIINNTSEYQTLAESKSDYIVNQSVIPTMVLSVVAYPIAGVSGALAVLSSCGGNIRLTSPLSTLNFLRLTSEKGILIKDGRALEKTAEVNTVVFDKTGTLTLDQFHVKTVYTCDDFSEDMLLIYAATAEQKQKHPIANAILTAAYTRKLNLFAIEEARYEIGYGIKVNISHRIIRVGSERFMKMENILIPDKINSIQKNCHAQGYSLVLVAIDNKVLGAIELHPIIRPNAKEVIGLLKQQGIATYIISGDHEQPTRMLAHELGVDGYFADSLPKQKARIIKNLQKNNHVVCFVGDGINDSIALKQADVSISLSGASVAAVDSAQIILLEGKLDYITQLIEISHAFEKNQKTNLVYSMIPNIVCVGGVFLLSFGIYTSLLLYYGSLAMGIRNTTKPIIKELDLMESN